ncbi:MAG: hypothetical protein AMXMBFR58_20690 [Phycisphaerae bacterium]
MKRTGIIAAVVAAGLAAPMVRGQCNLTWFEGFGVPGVASGYTTNVYAQIPWDPDGDGPDPEVLVVAGYMESANGVPAKWVATWDGVKFKQLGDGFDGWVFDLAIYNGELYAGGQFHHSGSTPCAKIARWSGTGWQAVAGSITAGGFEGVNALQVHDGSLYAAGVFQKAGSVTVNNIARFDGTTWHSCGWSSAGPGVGFNSLASYGGQLYAGGTFNQASSGFDYIARYNGSTWSGVGGGVQGQVKALHVIDGKLVAAGGFTQPGRFISTWNGTTWLATWADDAGMDASVESLGTFNGKLVVGGNFSHAGGAPMRALAMWNGTVGGSGSWQAVGTVAGDAPVFSFSTYNGQLYAGFYLGSFGGRPLHGIGRFDGTQWQPLGLGFNGAIHAWCWHDGELYAAGAFTEAGGTYTTRIARKTPAGWEPLGGGLTGPVNALASYQGTLVAGGAFSGGTLGANNLAWWDGSWHTFGAGSTNGVNSAVNALAVRGADLIIGGTFTTAGGSAANRIVKWNGSGFAPMGEGFSSGSVLALLSDGELYAGGSFNASGTTTLNGVARWNGSAWVPVGGGLGMYRSVYALGRYNGELVAGGYELNPGLCAARFDGSSWSALGPTSVWGACFPAVSTFHEHEGELYAGGTFSCGSLGRNVLRWNGSAWGALQGGVDGSVRALTTDDDGALVVGGLFATVNQTIASTCIAKWGCDPNGCPADFDGSGFVDTDDFTAFVIAFEAGDQSADFDGTGFVDTDDFTAFVLAFEAGC